MTTIDSSPDGALSEPSAFSRMLAADADWLTSTDHKKIGRLFLGGGLLGLLATVVVNVLVSLERVDGSATFIDSGAWSQLVSSQLVGLVFAAALPLAAGLCVSVVPLQLGSRSLAFPRLALLGFYAWFGGLVLAIVSMATNGGIGGGDADMVDLFLAAHGVMALGFVAVAISVVTTVLTTRAPGMTMRRVPFFAWSAMVFGVGLVLVMPVLFGTIVYLFVDHRSGAREAFGGNEGIYQWAGWIFTQPTSFLLAIPALGVFAELLPLSFRKRTPMRGVVYAALSLVGIAAFAGTTQQLAFEVRWDGASGEQRFQDVVTWAFFHLLPLLGAGLLLLMGLFLAKPERSADGERRGPNVTAAFPFALFGYLMVMVGIVGAAISPWVDLDLLPTVFGEAALVYVVYGAALGVMGGVVLWAPKLWGHELEMKKVAPLALLGVAGTALAAFPLYIAAFLDQPAGLAYDDSDLQIWNVLSLIGHGLFALTVLAFVGLCLGTFRGEPGAADDPVDGQTIEWATTSPAPADNFIDVPTVGSAEPLLDAKEGSA